MRRVEITFEGYASNGIAVFVEATTDNNNRTVASVRSIFNKYGGTYQCLVQLKII